MAKKKNWDKISDQKPLDTAKYRDVYEDQQLDRGQIMQMQTMTSRTIVSIVVGVLAALLMYLILSIIQHYTPNGKIWTWPNNNAVVEQTTEAGTDGQGTGTQTTESVGKISEADAKAYGFYYDGYHYIYQETSMFSRWVREVNGSVDDAHFYSTYADIPNGATLSMNVEESGGSEEPSTEAVDVKAILMEQGYDYNGNHYSYNSMTDSWFNDNKEWDVVMFNDIPDSVKQALTATSDNSAEETSSEEQVDPKERLKAEGFNYGGHHYTYNSVTDSWFNDDKEYDVKMYNDIPEEIRNSTSVSSDGSAEIDVSSITAEDVDLKAYKKDGFNYNGVHYSYNKKQDLWVLDEGQTAEKQSYTPDEVAQLVVKATGSVPQKKESIFMWNLGLFKVITSFLTGLMVFALLHMVLKKNLAAVNLMADTSDINQYKNDQHIQLPEEMMKNYDWFPDVGAHSNVQVSSMISHVMLQKKGLKNVDFARRYDKDVLDEDGDPEYFKNEIMEDENGNILKDSVPIIDEAFGKALFDASGAPEDKSVRKMYDTTKIPYNPGGKNRVKQAGKQDTVAQMINEDWDFPIYEPQRPAGAYIVDTEPVNTMVLAITRAGKGQTVIEPTIDMWTREKRPNNMVINDPKGELLCKNYVRGTMRGFQIVQFNLINAMKTDIYNPLALAADAAREGDSTKCAMYVENIAEVFFPLDGGDDPVWPNAANNAFKRAAYGMIDYYLEEEKELRLVASQTGMDEKVLERKIDELWGKVTLYNCYQLFVQLSSKKKKSPAAEFTAKAKAGEFDSLSDEEYQVKMHEAEEQSKLWEDKPEADMLTLFFNATDKLPKNSMRTLVGNANNALKSMAGAEKMLASVYGIAITAMSFFTDPTISTLTSGTLSQNVDLAGMSFPRRLGVRFHSDYCVKYSLIGMQAKWMAFEDESFTKPLGKDFEHEDLINREGWAKYYFKGIFPKERAYCRLQIIDPNTGLLIKTFYFRFDKGYQTNLKGREYVTDPILEERIVKNGILTELVASKKEKGKYKKGHVTFKKKMIDMTSSSEPKLTATNAIISKMVRYSEKTKMVFLVTPPHLMKYAKLILILIKQLVDLNFDQSYMTKSNQKPLYKTRFMLDELGNLQSEGHGISGFETMLSIGLGQEQQFTLILQTLQQLKDVYGDSVDKIVQGNTSNIVFLKSTDDTMIDTLSKMSGVRHKSYIESKTITRDVKAITQLNQNEGKTSYTMSTKEEPVLSYNDFAYITERNSIILRAGDSPIWNRNETILPMSWRLFGKEIINAPGKEFTLQTIPTLSSAKEFDVKHNQPDFGKMLAKRMEQAFRADEAMEAYRVAYDYNDYQMSQLNIDDLSDEVMSMINMSILHPEGFMVNDNDEFDLGDLSYEELEALEDSLTEMNDFYAGVSDNEEQMKEIQKTQAEQAENDMPRYAGGMLARGDLVSPMGCIHQLDKIFIEAFDELRGDFQQERKYFVFNGQDLYSNDGSTLYIKTFNNEADREAFNKAMESADSRTYGEEEMLSYQSEYGHYGITDDFLRFLCTFSGPWPFCGRKFEKFVSKKLSEG